MGEVDHAHDAEDQGQPRGDQEQRRAELQAVEELFDQKGHRRKGSCFGASARCLRPTSCTASA